MSNQTAAITPESWKRKDAANPRKGSKKGWQRRVDELVKNWRHAQEHADELATENALLRTINAALKNELELERFAEVSGHDH